MFSHITIYPGWKWTLHYRINAFPPSVAIIQKPVSWSDSKPNKWFLYKMQHWAEMGYTFLYIRTSQIFTMLNARILIVFTYSLEIFSFCSCFFKNMLTCRWRKLRLWTDEKYNVIYPTCPCIVTSNYITKYDFDGAVILS